MDGFKVTEVQCSDCLTVQQVGLATSGFMLCLRTPNLWLPVIVEMLYRHQN